MKNYISRRNFLKAAGAMTGAAAALGLTAAAVGNHEQLMATSEIYQEIYYSQQKGGLD